MGQLAGIRFELGTRGRVETEAKDKARQRGVASPDRAEALMLAIGKPVYVWQPPLWMQQDTAARRFLEGRKLEQIADDLEATIRGGARLVARRRSAADLSEIGLDALLQMQSGRRLQCCRCREVETIAGHQKCPTQE